MWVDAAFSGYLALAAMSWPMLLLSNRWPRLQKAACMGVIPALIVVPCQLPNFRFGLMGWLLYLGARALVHRLRARSRPRHSTPQNWTESMGRQPVQTKPLHA